jgi:hypothetical protein
MEIVGFNVTDGGLAENFPVRHNLTLRTGLQTPSGTELPRPAQFNVTDGVANPVRHRELPRPAQFNVTDGVANPVRHRELPRPAQFNVTDGVANPVRHRENDRNNTCHFDQREKSWPVKIPQVPYGTRNDKSYLIQSGKAIKFGLLKKAKFTAI